MFGYFLSIFPPDQDSLELTYTSTSRPINQGWGNKRLSAYFVADYFSNFLPVDEEDSRREKRIQESKGAVSYVANELLENAIKFNDEAVHSQIKFGIHFIEDKEVTAIVFATNRVKAERVETFQALIQELLTEDPNELYIRQVEKSAEEENCDASGLGLLTIINDYGARLGCKFETTQTAPNVVAVTTMDHITLL